MAALRWLAALLLLAAGSARAQAHLLPAQTATMNLVGDTAYLVVSVPVSALPGIDDDRSGGVSAQEIARHSRDIAAAFNRGFRVSADGAPGQPLMTMAWHPQTEGPPADSAYVVVLHSVRFAEAPREPMVSTDLFGTLPGEAQMTLTAKIGKREDTAEVAVLRPGAASHRFFRGALGTFADFVRLGIEHILTGPDHLLFLLTVLIAGAGWRYWLGVATSFTIAHSITLTLAALGLVRVSPAVVEPGIAASIVLMALLNLWRGGRVAGGLRVRLALVFACGLLHGLGFAAAIGTMLREGTQRIATLAGFNLGIELGQLAFLALLLGLGLAMRRLIGAPRALALPRLGSMLAALLGTGLLVQRLVAA